MRKQLKFLLFSALLIPVTPLTAHAGESQSSSTVDQVREQFKRLPKNDEHSELSVLPRLREVLNGAFGASELAKE